MGKKIIAVVAFGEVPNDELLRKILEEADTIIAADGGANVCMKIGVKPDFVIGDLDSITDLGFPEVIKQTNQSLTDMEKALDFALLLNPKKVIITAAFGKRKDHSFINLLIFRKYSIRAELEIYDNFGKLRIFQPGKHEINGTRGKTVSMFSLNEMKELSLKGFRFNLKKQSFTPLFYGQSNVFESEKCCIEFAEGTLYVYEVFEESEK
jgi:thiamine pyrophosphokinase